MLDGAKYPRTTAYLSRLPVGLDSYPQAQVKAEAHDGLRKVFQEAGIRDLPEPFQSFVGGGPRDEWIPEVYGNALLLMARDRVFRTDREFLAWVARNMEELSLHPVYRVMMRMFSATLVVMGTAKRWGAFHKGTELVSGPVDTVAGRDVTTLTLIHPARLYTELLLENLGTLHTVVLKGCRAEDPKCRVELASETESRFHLSWKA